jgi:hypothetical protein
LEWLDEGFGFDVVYRPEQTHSNGEPDHLKKEIAQLRTELKRTPKTIIGDFPVYEDTGDVGISYVGSGGPSCGGGTVHVLVGHERCGGPNPIAYGLESRIKSAERKLAHASPWVVDSPEQLTVVRGSRI